VPEASELGVCVLKKESTSEEEEPLEEDTSGCEGSSEASEEGMVPITVAPVDPKEGAGFPNLVDENAVISGNTASSADTVIRPLYDGGLAFGTIRDETAPEEYSWRVELSHDQELRLADGTHAEVYYNDSTPAFSITAEPAHDAIGTEVPTSLSVSNGDVLTMTIHYRAGHEGQPYVYPIIGGTGWQGGFRTTEVGLTEPEPEWNSPEEQEVWELEELQEGNVILGVTTIGPPEDEEFLTKTEKLVMELNPMESWRKSRKKFRFDICHPHKIGGDPAPIEGPHPDPEARRELMKVLRLHCRDPKYEGNFWRFTVSGRFHFVQHNRVWLNWKEWDCQKTGGDKAELEFLRLEHCEAFFPNEAHYPSGTRFKGPIEALAEYRFPAGTGQWGAEAVPNCLTAGGWLYPNPRKGPGGYYEEPLEYQRAHSVRLGEYCPPISP
jgi:hypothetical protein